MGFFIEYFFHLLLFGLIMMFGLNFIVVIWFFFFFFYRFKGLRITLGGGGKIIFKVMLWTQQKATIISQHFQISMPHHFQDKVLRNPHHFQDKVLRNLCALFSDKVAC